MSSLRLNECNTLDNLFILVGGEPGCFIVENHLSRFIEGSLVLSCLVYFDTSDLSSLTAGSLVLSAFFYQIYALYT